MHLGVFLTAVIAFLILAAVVYFFVVVPYTRAKEPLLPDPAGRGGHPRRVALLQEIRDLLAARVTG